MAKPKIKKLPSGERVTVDENGDLFLVSSSPLRERLNAARADNEVRHQEIHQMNQDLLQSKKDSLDSHPSVAPDKRIV